MRKPLPLFSWFKIALLIVMLLFLALAIWARFAVSQRAVWTPVAWQLAPEAPLGPQIQSGLDKETSANSVIVGQGLHVIAPRLGIDATFVSGQDVLATDDVRVASNIKPFVAAAALKLVETGQLKLNAPIGPYLSDPMRKLFKRRKSSLDTITLRHLLNHSSGLIDYGNSTLFQAVAYIPTAYGLARHWTPEEQVWFSTNLLAQNPLGTRFDYADTNYLLAADMIAKATGMDNAGQALRALLDWPKIGAEETYWEGYEPAPQGTRIARHFRGLIEDTHLDVSFDQYGSGGLVMSMDDLARAHRHVVSGAAFADPQATLAIMQTKGLAEGTNNYALGVFETQIEGVTCWGHGGRWGTIALYCPAIDLTIARSWGQANAGPDFGDPKGMVATLVRLSTKKTP